MSWTIAGVDVNGVDVSDATIERTRGESLSVRVLIGSAGDAPTITTTVLGGGDGTTYGGATGGTASTADTDPARDRYETLRQYGEFAGAATVERLIGGDVTIAESPQPAWPVDSHVVYIDTHDSITTPFWALVTGYDDASRTRPLEARRYIVSFELAFLADGDAYDSVDELKDDLAPVTVQL